MNAPPFTAQDLSLGAPSRMPRARMPLPAALILAAAFAVAFTLTPWNEISGQGFPDRDNYVATISVLMEEGATPFEFRDADMFALLLNEYLWREILIVIGNAASDPVQGLLIVSLIAVTIIITFVLRRAGVAYALLFLLAPLMVDLFISQTRSALALAIFAVSLAARRPLVRYGLIAAATMVHSIGAVLFAVYQCNEFVLSRPGISSRVKLTAAALLGMAVSAVWVFLSTTIFSAIGDRRADHEAMQPVSLSFAVFWILMIAFVIMFARLRSQGRVDACAMLAVTLLTTFVFGTIFGIGSLRFLALALPFALIAVRSTREIVLRTATLAGIAVFNLIHASYWVL